jgi:hypothetical protein
MLITVVLIQPQHYMSYVATVGNNVEPKVQHRGESTHAKSRSPTQPTYYEKVTLFSSTLSSPSTTTIVPTTRRQIL